MYDWFPKIDDKYKLLLVVKKATWGNGKKEIGTEVILFRFDDEYLIRYFLWASYMCL
jgi:hypothetical protein